jgi:MYXO-CTERM domain-containing protein
VLRPQVLLVVAAGASVAAAITVARPALAHGSFPASNRIVFSPTDPNLIVARTTYGILPSRDDGATWSYLCEDAMGLPPTSYHDPTLALTANNALVAALPEPQSGLSVSTDMGCSWSCAGGAMAGQSFADGVVRPDAPHDVLALSATQQTTDGGVAFTSQVFRSVDDGATWSTMGQPIDRAFGVQSIDVSRADAHGGFRVYVTAIRGYGAARIASLFVSSDLGASWTEHPVADFDPATEDLLLIAGVDPMDADRVYLRTSASVAGGRTRLYLSTDGGASFTVASEHTVPQAAVYAVTGEALAFALSEDGSRVYVGTKEDGLLVASRTDMAFTRTSPIHVQCLATRGPELWVCADQASTAAAGAEFVVGMTLDEGAHLTPKLATISSLCAPVDCPAAAPASLACNASFGGGGCGDSFAAFCSVAIDSACGTCGADAGSDAGGARDGSAALDGGPTHDASASKSTPTVGGGCSASGPEEAGSTAAALVGLAALALARRSRPRQG